jgi:hypothetical protein
LLRSAAGSKFYSCPLKLPISCNIEKLHEVLNEKETRSEALEILCSLVEAIQDRPAENGPEVTLVCQIVNMLKLPKRGAFSLAEYESSVKLVAGARYQRCLRLAQGIHRCEFGLTLERRAKPPYSGT